ncbi:MAG: hypothetical protein LBU89_11175 [Fibromonadaceae bacterium]|jgi:hypothetical protein|nr:hypothetical protein [Fibromonadaceae bacterium]
MKISRFLLLATSFLFAMIFIFSCSSEDANDVNSGGSNKYCVYDYEETCIYGLARCPYDGVLMDNCPSGFNKSPKACHTSNGNSNYCDPILPNMTHDNMYITSENECRSSRKGNVMSMEQCLKKYYYDEYYENDSPSSSSGGSTKYCYKKDCTRIGGCPYMTSESVCTSEGGTVVNLSQCEEFDAHVYNCY